MVEDKKSLKFAGQCNGAICEGEHFVYSLRLWHPSYGAKHWCRQSRENVCQVLQKFYCNIGGKTHVIWIEY